MRFEYTIYALWMIILQYQIEGECYGWKLSSITNRAERYDVEQNTRHTVLSNFVRTILA